jgi:hypothetical protein
VREILAFRSYGYVLKVNKDMHVGQALQATEGHKDSMRLNGVMTIGI